MSDHPFDDLVNYMEAIGYPVWDEALREHARGMIAHGVSVEEAKTQRCDDCNAVIDKHQTALWRESVHVIRCGKCQKKAMEAGYDAFEAKFVC